MRYATLDGLRGIAILMVIYQHAYATHVIGWLGRRNIPDYFVGDGWIGVTLFFVLSGFVLSLPFMGRENVLLDVREIRSFLVKRARRLLPLFFFVSAIGFVIFVDTSRISVLLLTISTLHMFVPSQFYPLVNGPFWSLSIEIWASVAIPFLILAGARFGYVRLFLTVAAVALSVRMISALPGLTESQRLAVRDSVPGRLDDFVAGILLAWLFANHHLQRTRHCMFFASIAALIVGCLAFDMAPWLPSAARPLANIWITLGFSLLVAYSLSENSALRRILNIWPLQIFGLMCFSLYSWHNLVIAVNHRNGRIDGEIGFWIVLIALSAFTYSYIEFPKVNVLTLFRIDPDRLSFKTSGRNEKIQATLVSADSRSAADATTPSMALSAAALPLTSTTTTKG